MLSYRQQLIEYLAQFLNTDRVKLLKEKASKRTKHVCLVLDGIKHEHNISALVRTSECFGMQDLHILERKANYADNRKINKGSNKWLTISRYDSGIETNTCIKTLKSAGYQIVATTLHSKCIGVSELDLNKKTAIVLGAEASGVSPEVLQEADAYLKIETAGFTESLNVSVAGAVISHALLNRLKKEEINYLIEEETYEDLLLSWLKNEVYSSEEIINRFEAQ